MLNRVNEIQEYEVFYLEKSESSGYDLLPNFEHEKLFCMTIADGDYFKYKELYDFTEISEIYETFALKIAMNYRPKNDSWKDLK